MKKYSLEEELEYLERLNKEDNRLFVKAAVLIALSELVFFVLLDTLCELPKTMLLSIHCEHCGEVVTKVPPSCVEFVIFNAICEKCSGETNERK